MQQSHMQHTAGYNSRSKCFSARDLTAVDFWRDALSSFFSLGWLGWWAVTSSNTLNKIKKSTFLNEKSNQRFNNNCCNELMGGYQHVARPFRCPEARRGAQHI